MTKPWPPEGHPEHCGLCAERHKKRVADAIKKVIDKHAEVLQKLAEQDTKDKDAKA